MATWRKRLVGQRNWLRPLKSLLFIYVPVALVACSFANRFIFRPPDPQYSADDENILVLDPGPDQVACCFLPPAPGERVLLWAHGNAEDIGLLKPILTDLHNRGFGILAFDYPGYGHSAGSPSERSCFRVADRAWRFLVHEQNIDPSRIVLLGQSIGSGSACWLAEHHTPGGLILVSPLTSAFRTVTRIPLLPGDKFRNLKRIRKIETPLLIIHGRRDREVPFAHGQRLFKEHRGPKEFLEVPNAGHNDLWHLAHHQLLEAIHSFATSPPPNP